MYFRQFNVSPCSSAALTPSTSVELTPFSFKEVLKVNIFSFVLLSQLNQCGNLSVLPGITHKKIQTSKTNFTILLMTANFQIKKSKGEMRTVSCLAAPEL